MDMKKYIEMGEKASGSQLKLAEYLGQFDTAIRRIKRGKAGLPNPLCIKLAQLIKVNPLDVIVASELVTEKNEERRKLLESCFSKAAGILLIVGISSIVTPTPAQAAPALESMKENTVYYVKLQRTDCGNKESRSLRQQVSNFPSTRSLCELLKTLHYGGFRWPPKIPEGSLISALSFYSL